MNRFKKLTRAAAAFVIILMVGSVMATEIEFKINPNKLPPCPKPNLSKKSDSERIKNWTNCWGRYQIEFDGTSLPDSDKGDTLEGEWRNGNLNGIGMNTSGYGDKSFGQYKFGKQHGLGKWIFTTGDMYVGEFKGGERNGQGTFTHSNGDKYVGQYKDGKMHGKGTFTYANGSKYVGEYKDDVANGQGTIIYSTGSKYVGDIVDGVPTGSGVLTHISGTKYVGRFKGGDYFGEGVLTESNGKRFEGVWENTFQAKGIYTDSNGQRFEGNWEFGKFVGAGKLNEEKLTDDIAVSTDGAHINRQIRKENNSPRPNLQVTNTVPDANGVVQIKLKTNTDTASLEINGEEHGGSKNGIYSIKKVARAGQETVFTIVATDINGNVDTKTITVNRPVVESQAKFAALNPAQVKKQPERDAVAIIIGIADYKNLPRADFANDDASVFYDYAIRALGIKPENIKLLVDGNADDVAIYQAFKTWLPSRVRATTDVYVYYSGHGLPAEDGQGLYLLPQRAHRDLIEKTAISQREINGFIQAAKAKSVTIFLDSCYSGLARTGETLLASARPVTLKADKKLFPDEFTVITASQADQISSSSPDLKHGIFSYYLMRGMEGEADANRDGKITVGEMHGYLAEQVNRQAGMMNRRQEPQLVGDANRVLSGW